MERRMVRPDYSTPVKKRRYIESEIRRAEDAVKRVNPDAEAYLSGSFAARRKKALLNYLDRVEEELGSLGLASPVESFARRELVTFSNYNSIDVNGDILTGASLWILDKLRAGGKMKDAYDILPDVSGDLDSYCLPVDLVSRRERKRTAGRKNRAAPGVIRAAGRLRRTVLQMAPEMRQICRSGWAVTGEESLRRRE